MGQFSFKQNTVFSHILIVFSIQLMFFLKRSIENYPKIRLVKAEILVVVNGVVNSISCQTQHRLCYVELWLSWVFDYKVYNAEYNTMNDTLYNKVQFTIHDTV